MAFVKGPWPARRLPKTTISTHCSLLKTFLSGLSLRRRVYRLAISMLNQTDGVEKYRRPQGETCVFLQVYLRNWPIVFYGDRVKGVG